MSNIKPMVDHIAKAYLELSGFPADADGDVKASALVVATRLLAGAPVLYDSLKDEELRKLLTYLESKDSRDDDGDSVLGYYESMYEGPAYRDAAKRLRRILDGEDND